MTKLVKAITLSAMLLAGHSVSAQSMTQPSSTQKAVIAFTTDVHGHFFPFDFIRLEEAPGSLARIKTVVDQLIDSLGYDPKNDHSPTFMLLDNGDMLQGQPTAYYYNYIDTAGGGDSLHRHIISGIYSDLNYVAANIGNHDIEAGHSVFDRVRHDAPIPFLGANVGCTVDSLIGRPGDYPYQPYFEPYIIYNPHGLKIAVIGLVTPAVPSWVPERQWSGMEFHPMVESARRWVEIVKRKEQPDIIIGLFHSGSDASNTTGDCIENASRLVAEQVPGFDAILMGHDHRLCQEVVTSANGSRVHLINPANNAMNLGVVRVDILPDGTKHVSTEIIDASNAEPDETFMSNYAEAFSDVKQWVSRPIGTATTDIETRPAFFGPSAFMSLIHRLQLDISGADISLAAPLTFDGIIHEGTIRVADMFTLYKYENMLCTLRLTGQEIKDHLEHSYDGWIQTITPSQPHLIKFASAHPTPQDNRLATSCYNFDTAAGITYTVDVTKPRGERVNITAMSSGQPFSLDSTYTVVTNSYRALGGGNHLTKGAGIDPDKLKDRITSSSDKDMRFYMMQLIKKWGKLDGSVDHNWRFIPEDIALPAINTDDTILFGPSASKKQK